MNSMKQFQIKWGQGSIKNIETVYKTMTVEANNMDDIDPIIILPDNVKKEISYIRYLVASETKRHYDYGSWSEFIEVEER